MTPFNKFLFINTVVSIVFAYSYNLDFINRRFVLKNRVNLHVIIMNVLMPLVYITIGVSLLYTVYLNPVREIAYFSNTIFGVFSYVIAAIGFTGLGMHIAAKSVSCFLPKKGKIVEVNKLFHVTLSHFLMFTSTLLFILNIILFEFIHPFNTYIPKGELILIVMLGILCGILYGLAIARARSYYLYYIFISTLCAIIGTLILIRGNELHKLPISVFFTIGLIFCSATQILYLILHSLGKYSFNYHPFHFNYEVVEK